jgi:carboxypeptidase Taq
MGAFGYFPSYALGNIYSVMFYNQFLKETPSFLKKMNLDLLINWLKNNIHRHGKFYDSETLIKKITNKKPTEKEYINYLWEKYSAIYEF